MSFWWWVLLFVGIGVLALAVFAALGLMLWRKAKVLMAELARLSALGAEAGDAMSSVGQPGGARPGLGRTDADPSGEEWAAVAGRHRAL